MGGQQLVDERQQIRFASGDLHLLDRGVLLLDPVPIDEFVALGRGVGLGTSVALGSSDCDLVGAQGLSAQRVDDGLAVTFDMAESNLVDASALVDGHAVSVSFLG